MTFLSEFRSVHRFHPLGCEDTIAKCGCHLKEVETRVGYVADTVPASRLRNMSKSWEETFYGLFNLPNNPVESSQATSMSSSPMQPTVHASVQMEKGNLLPCSVRLKSNQQLVQRDVNGDTAAHLVRLETQSLQTYCLAKQVELICPPA